MNLNSSIYEHSGLIDEKKAKYQYRYKYVYLERHRFKYIN